jgi:hypothetical protein
MMSLRNPEGSAARGNWSDPKFLEQIGTPQFNADLKDTQFADFHSHGWVFRAVYKRDRHGHLLDQDGNLLPDTEDEALSKAVHLADIHLEKGMQCIDCHFTQDVHGNGKLYGETRNAVEIGCMDCHGTIYSKAALKTSGPASANDASSNLLRLRTPFKQARFYWQDGKLWQRSNVVEGSHPVGGGADARLHHAGQSALLGEVAAGEDHAEGRRDLGPRRRHAEARPRRLAHDLLQLPLVVDDVLLRLPSLHVRQPEMPMLHNEGETTRNYTNYNFMVLRDDVYMLGVDGTVTGNKIAPVRSPARWWSVRRTPTATGSISSSRPSRRRASAARPSAPTCRIRCAPRRPRAAPTATSQRMATTTRGWRNCWCRAPTS